MSSGWSAFVIVLTLLNIAACVWLMWWTAQPKHPGEAIGDGSDTGHVWDGDLREYNNPMPRWWLWLFYLTIAFSIVYLVLYPGLGALRGTKGWSQATQYEVERRAAEERAAAWFAPLAQLSVPQLAADPRAMSAAHNLFQNNCAQCHGSDGGGGPGFPNLGDGDWLWGGDPDSIVQSIQGGRIGVMPPWGDVLGADGVEEVLAYVATLSGRTVDPASAANGRARFETVCAACHGADGRGMAVLGAPNLTDAIWLHGADDAAMRRTVVQGRNGQMPAFGDLLGEQRVRLLAAYVLDLSRRTARDDDDEHRAGHDDADEDPD